MQNQTRNLAVVALIAALIVVIGWNQLPGQGEPNKPAADSKLKVLLKEKVAIAQEAATQATKAYQSGQVSFAEVVEANLVLGKAQLDLCDTSTARIEVLERMLAQARHLEKVAAEHVKAGEARGSTLLKAKLNRLDVEVALERAKDNKF